MSDVEKDHPEQAVDTDVPDDNFVNNEVWIAMVDEALMEEDGKDPE